MSTIEFIFPPHHYWLLQNPVSFQKVDFSRSHLPHLHPLVNIILHHNFILTINKSFEWVFLFFLNLGQNSYRLFYILLQFLLTASEEELDYYHQEVNARVAEWFTERLKDTHWEKAPSNKTPALRRSTLNQLFIRGF